MKEGHALRCAGSGRCPCMREAAVRPEYGMRWHCTGGMEREWLQARRRVCVLVTVCVYGSGAGLRRSTKGRRWRCPTRQVRRRRQKRAAQTQSKPTALRRPPLAAAAESCSLATTP